jgi:glycosyltransferase involved in cell wall biosynthesis
MQPSPIVSVIIAAFNAQRWINLSIESAQSQTLREIEIIVVDDGSTDDTAEMVMRIAKDDPRIHLIQQPNAGVGAARNAGIRSARGKFVAPLDADDLWQPEKLARQVKRMEERGEETALIYCWHQWLDEDGVALGWESPFRVEGMARSAIILRNFIGNASVPLFRSDAVHQAGLYLTRDEQGGAQGCEDWDLSIRIAERWEIGLVDDVLVGYRQTHACMSSQAPSMAQSFQMVMDRARLRNVDLPLALFRWAEGHFQSYLVSKSYGSCDYPSCIVAASRAILSDPVLILNRNLHQLTLKSLIWLATGKRRSAPRRPNSDDAKKAPARSPRSSTSLLDQIQNRRWASVLGSECLPH